MDTRDCVSISLRTSRSALAIVLISVVGLSGGCAELDQISKEKVGTGLGSLAGGLIGSQFGSAGTRLVATAVGAVAGAWFGKVVGVYLDEQDRRRAAEAARLAAMTGRPQVWSNPDTGVSGRADVVNTKTTRETVSVQVIKDRVQQVPPLKLIGESYQATVNANVRGGPSTEYVILGGLRQGETVTVAGKVEGKPWYLISRGGAGSGFVYADLLTPTPTAVVADVEATLPADVVEVRDVPAARTCQTVQQTITLADGSTHREEVTACRGPNGWEVV